MCGYGLNVNCKLLSNLLEMEWHIHIYVRHFLIFVYDPLLSSLLRAVHVKVAVVLTG